MTAEGLTEAEREALREVIADGRVTDAVAQHGPPKDHALLHRVLRAECARFVEHAAPAVERILADRLAAVQAERQRLNDEADLIATQRNYQYNRAESAEAERDALRERVKALASEADARVVRTAEIRAALDADRSTDPSAGSERA